MPVTKTVRECYEVRDGKPCAVNFWRTLWPLFIAELRRETEPAACAA